MKCTKPGCDGTLTKMDVKCMNCGWTIERIYQEKAKQQKESNKSHIKISTAPESLRERAGERYAFISRFLHIMKILSVISAIGWLIMADGFKPEVGVPLAITGIIYTWVIYSIIKLITPLVDIAVNSYVNEELLKENTDYLRQLVEIEKFKLRRSGQMPSE